MCAIVDANVVSEVFGSNLPPAGEKFFDWLNKGSGRLIVGGKLLEELENRVRRNSYAGDRRPSLLEK